MVSWRGVRAQMWRARATVRGFGDKSNLDEFLVNTAMLETSQFDISPLNFVIANMWLTSVTLDTPQFERPPSKFEKANE